MNQSKLSLKILSWNILGVNTIDTPRFKNRHAKVTNWPHRYERILKQIRLHHPDILCLQEIDLERKKNFSQKLSDTYTLASYEQKGKNGGVTLFYKTNLFDLTYQNHVQCPATGTLWQPGACAWAVLKHNETGKKICIVSAHLQPKEIKTQLLEFAQAFGSEIDLPIIITGDFNTKHPAIKQEVIPYLNQLRVSIHQFSMFEHSSWTHQWAHDDDLHANWSSVDHCLYTNNIQLNMQNSFVADHNQSYMSELATTATKSQTLATLPTLPNDTFPSDHLPLIINIQL